MSIEMGLWRVDGDQPRRVEASSIPSEAVLESFLEADPTLLGERLLVIGRQVRTPHGKRIDLLAMDAEGNLRILELKRDRTPRDVVAQTLDYGSWVSQLDHDAVVEIANEHLDSPFEVEFAEVFGESPPDDLNTDLQLTVVATGLDPSSERIVTYLRDLGVPINAVFFAHLEDEGRRYLARSWLVTPDERPAGTTVKPSKRADWNGRDWFVSCGEGGTRSWDDARQYNFVSAGGGPWYSSTLRKLPIEGRVFVSIPGRGYVGVGVTVGEARRIDVAQVRHDGGWTPLRGLSLQATYDHYPGQELTDDNAEWVVPVDWLVTRSRDEAYWEKGMFASQHSACKLRQEFTLQRLYDHFELTEAGAD